MSMTKALVGRGMQPWLARFSLRRNWDLYLMLIPGILYFLIFHYGPIYGLQIAFKNFSPSKGILGSQWVGLKHFGTFFSGYYFKMILTNTILISLYQLLVGFPAPLILALSINEVQNKRFQRIMQTATYAPHFLSVTVLVAMAMAFLSPQTGVINKLILALGGESRYFMVEPGSFKTIYALSGVWQNAGWGSIIYLAALSGVPLELYESAKLDGATRFQRLIYINLPHLLPTIIILFILESGKIMSIGFEKVFLMQNELNLEASEVISTYVYRKGILGAQYSFSAAVGLFNSIINFGLMLGVNAISRRVSAVSLW